MIFTLAYTKNMLGLVMQHIDIIYSLNKQPATKNKYI